uniref:Uncharacterized protein n=1 Tax=Arundo donax TaxID=35708 RepID=A0A0A9GVX8_ARUDO
MIFKLYEKKFSSFRANQEHVMLQDCCFII